MEEDEIPMLRLEEELDNPDSGGRTVFKGTFKSMEERNGEWRGILKEVEARHGLQG